MTYTARDLAYNTTVLKRTYTTYKEYEYGLAQGETKTFTLANLDLGTNYAIWNIQFGVWGGGGGGGGINGTGRSSGGGGGFAGKDMVTGDFSTPAVFTANVIGDGGSGGSSSPTNGSNGGDSTGVYNGGTYTATGGERGLLCSGSSCGGTAPIAGAGGVGSAPAGGTTANGGHGGAIGSDYGNSGGAGGGARGGSFNSYLLGSCSTGSKPGSGGTGRYQLLSGSGPGCAGGGGRVSLYWRHYPPGHPNAGAMP